MRLRMYVTLPDVQSARQLANDLLLARIEDRRMHFLARRGTDLGELHEASYLHKTDTMHAAFVGMILGGALGAVLGAIVVNYPPGSMSLCSSVTIERLTCSAVAMVSRIASIAALTRYRWS